MKRVVIATLLPDFPKEKALAQEQLDYRIQEDLRKMLGPFRDSPMQRMHEGHRLAIGQDNGDLSESQLEEISEIISLETEHIPDITPEEFRNVLKNFIEKMAEKQAKFHYGRLTQAISKVGNSLDAGGRPLTPELLLEMYELIQIDFSPEGKPYLPTLVVGPELMKPITEKPEWIEPSQDFQMRFDELIEKKRNEWRAREACRRLVD